MAGSSLPSPLRFVPCIFIARRFQLFLPSSTCFRPIVPTTRAINRRSQHSSWSSFIFDNKFKVSRRRDSNSWSNTISSITAFEGHHYYSPPARLPIIRAKRVFRAKRVSNCYLVHPKKKICVRLRLFLVLLIVTKRYVRVFAKFWF